MPVAVACLLLFGELMLAGFAPSAVAQAPAHPLEIDAVALVPRRGDKVLLDRIQANAATSASLTLKINLHYTMGNRETVDALTDELSHTRPSAVLFLDTASAQSLADRLDAPGIFITRSAAGILSGGEPPTSASLQSTLRRWVIETLPHANHLVNMIGQISPCPARFGLVYNQSEPSNEALVEAVSAILAKTGGAQVVACPIAPGACRNANEVRAAVQSGLESLSSGDPVVVVPGPNTLKFAYVIAQETAQRGLGLVGLGEWQGGPPAITLDVTPEAVAAGCLQVLGRLTVDAASSSSLPTVITPPSEVRTDPAALQALGWTLTPAAH